MAEPHKIDTLYDVTDHFLGELEMWLRQRGFKNTPPAGSGYSIVQDEGVNLPPQHVLDFIGSNVTAADDPTNNRTTVTITTAAATVASKSGDTAISSTTTVANDPHLKFSLGSSNTEIWLVELYLIVNSADALMGINTGWTYPTGCTIRWGGDVGKDGDTATGFGAIPRAVGTTEVALASESTILGYASSANNDWGMSLRAIVFGGGTAGTVNFAWAQVSSNAGSLTVRKGSCLRATKLAS